MSDDSEVVAAARLVLANIIAWGSGPAAPTFDEFDREVERKRGQWCAVDAEAVRKLRAAVMKHDAQAGEEEAMSAAARRKRGRQERGRGERILALVRDEPGIVLTALVKRTRAAYSTVLWHVDRLEAQGRLHSERVGRVRRLYARRPGRRVARDDVLASRQAARLVKALVAGGPSSAKELREQARLSNRMVYYHLGRFCEAGWARRTGASGAYRYAASARLLAKAKRAGKR